VVAGIAFIRRAIGAMHEGKWIITALFQSLDLITIAVPPALPLVLTVGISVSIARLKKSLIYCIDPDRLNYGYL
jgi:cation-transporting P-type ATPase 13A2